MSFRLASIVAVCAAGLFAAATPSLPQPHLQSCQGVPITVGAGTVAVCSKAFGAFHGACGVPQQQYPGEGWENVAIAVTPWEDSPIAIVAAVSTVRLRGNGPLVLGFFIGNSYDPDPMSPYEYFNSAGNELDGKVAMPVLPAYSGMIFPAKLKDQDYRGPHLDVHVNCTKGAVYEGYLMVWYTIPRDTTE